MKQRHHRKAKQCAMKRHARFNTLRLRLDAYKSILVRTWVSMRQFEEMWDRPIQPPEFGSALRTVGSMDRNDGADAFSYMAQCFQEPQLTPYTELELAAQHIVQQAELYDRSLPHYFHKGDPWEAIPHPQCMAESRRRYEELISEQADSLRVAASDVRREARRYSTSQAYVHWLRENPPS